MKRQKKQLTLLGLSVYLETYNKNWYFCFRNLQWIDQAIKYKFYSVQS